MRLSWLAVFWVGCADAPKPPPPLSSESTATGVRVRYADVDGFLAQRNDKPPPVRVELWLADPTDPAVQAQARRRAAAKHRVLVVPPDQQHAALGYLSQQAPPGPTPTVCTGACPESAP